MKKQTFKIVFFALFIIQHNCYSQITPDKKVPVLKYTNAVGNYIESIIQAAKNANIGISEGSVQFQISIKTSLNAYSQNWVAYGEAQTPLSAISQNRGTFNVRYIFSDRKYTQEDIYSIAGCKPTPNTNGEVVFGEFLEYRFNEKAPENANVTWSKTGLNLFEAWNWKIGKCYQINNVLYGECGDGHVFAISYTLVQASNVR